MFSGRLAPLFCVAFSSWLLGSVDLHAQVVFQGGEFQVNSLTFSNQHFPAVAVDADGDLLVTWSDDVFEGSRGIWAKRYSSSGALLIDQFRINTYTPNSQHESSVAVENNGDFVVVWESFTQDGPALVGFYGVFAQRFTSAGVAVGVEFQVNTYTPNYQFLPDVASDADGDFIVVWDTDFGQDGHSRGIFAQRFDSSGARQGVQFQVNTFTSSNQRNPAVAMEDNGDFVVVWDSTQQDGQTYGIFGQRFNSGGARTGAEFQVNSYTTDSQSVPDVAADSDGDFVVVWQSNHQDAPSPIGILGVFGQRFNSSGARRGSEFQVNVYFTGSQRYPAIAADDSGDFVVAWEGTGGQDGSDEGVFARRFSSIAAIGGEFRANTYVGDGQRDPVLAWDSDGDFIIVWSTDAPQDGNAAGVFAQRFKLPALAVLDVDGNGSVTPLGDGLMIIKYLFSLRDANLISGGVGIGCSRCLADEIEDYIELVRPLLDVDDNESVTPLGDGLIIIKYLFSLRDANLISGGVGLGCMRCLADEIEVYIESLKVP